MCFLFVWFLWVLALESRGDARAIGLLSSRSPLPHINQSRRRNARASVLLARPLHRHHQQKNNSYLRPTELTASTAENMAATSGLSSEERPMKPSSADAETRSPRRRERGGGAGGDGLFLFVGRVCVGAVGRIELRFSF